MKKVFFLFAAAVMSVAVFADKTVYLQPNLWVLEEAAIFVHSWAGEDFSDVLMTADAMILVF